jgi:hypothetical protein
MEIEGLQLAIGSVLDILSEMTAKLSKVQNKAFNHERSLLI